MTLQEQLITKGYAKHICESYRTFHMTDTLYQKKVVDDVGVRYFINIWYYPEQVYNEVRHTESMQAEVQFCGDGITNEHMDVTLFVRDIDIIEQVFDNIYTKLNITHSMPYE